LNKNNWFWTQNIINLRKPYSLCLLRLFDLSLKLNGFDISKAKTYLKQLQNQNPEHKAETIIKHRDAIVNYHIANCQFYKNHILASYSGNWESVPVMTKRDLQQPLKERLANGFHPGNIYKNKTSGSSGDPFIFAKDKWSHALTWAQIMDRFNWYGIDFNSSKQARFYGIPLNTTGYYKERLKDWFANRYRFSVFDLSDKAFEKALKKFETTAFDYINGYTSPIAQFAKFLRDKDICLKDLCPSLKVCIVTSEMLFESDKELMRSAFGIPLVNEYGASELDLIAFEHPDGKWRLNSDSLYIEILDEQDQVVPHGQEGRVVITSLFNQAHPFIRYELGDIAVIDEQSTLEKPILKSLIGRTNDLVQLPSGKTAAGLTFYYITKSVIEESGNVKEFVIEQTKLDSFLISYIAAEELEEHYKSKICSEIIKYLEPGLHINFERESQIKRSGNGKLKQFISRI